MWNLDRPNGKGTEDELRLVRALLETEAGKLEIQSWENSLAEELPVSGCLLRTQTGQTGLQSSGQLALAGKSSNPPHPLPPRKQDVSMPAGNLF